MIYDKKYLKVLNAKTNTDYNYYDEMRMFITKCNKKLNSKCKSDDKISTFLDQIILKMNVFEENSRFSHIRDYEFYETIKKETQ